MWAKRFSEPGLVAETGGLAALVHLCETSESEAVLEAAAGALRHVVYNNDSPLCQ
ncbi:hypothetical protein T484DRAFT_1806836 [Baffinella frigidus]|nr:hypothetical protein T484DRAFT_1806836 [Cryptophyta sp. CCMP2293]